MQSRQVQIESKRLLLWNAERRFRQTRLTEDSRLVSALKAELERAEARYAADSNGLGKDARSPKLRKLYLSLIATGSVAVEFLSAIAPHLSPSSQFDTAVRVQALEELIERWRGAVSLPRP